MTQKLVFSDWAILAIFIFSTLFLISTSEIFYYDDDFCSLIYNNKTCYLFGTDTETNHSRAIRICEETTEKGIIFKLAEIDSINEFEFLQYNFITIYNISLDSSHFWFIAATLVDGNWTWIYSQKQVYNDFPSEIGEDNPFWWGDQPNNEDGNEHCLELQYIFKYPDALKLNDRSCSNTDKERGYICKAEISMVKQFEYLSSELIRDNEKKVQNLSRTVEIIRDMAEILTEYTEDLEDHTIERNIELLNNILQALSNYTGAKETDDTSFPIDDLLFPLEELGHGIARFYAQRTNDSRAYTASSKTIMMEINIYSHPISQDVTDTSSADSTILFSSIPKDTTTNTTYTVTIVYNMEGSFSPDEGTLLDGNISSVRTFGSEIVSGILYPTQASPLAEPVRVKLALISEAIDPVCASLHENNLWSTNGCEFSLVTEIFIECRCEHTGMYAIMSKKEIEISSSDKLKELFNELEEGIDNTEILLDTISTLEDLFEEYSDDLDQISVEDIIQPLNKLVIKAVSEFINKKIELEQDKVDEGEKSTDFFKDLIFSLDGYFNSLAKYLSLSKNINQSSAVSIIDENIEMDISIFVPGVNDSINETTKISKGSSIDLPIFILSHLTMCSITTVYKTLGNLMIDNVTLKNETDILGVRKIGSEIISAIMHPLPPHPFEKSVVIKLVLIKEAKNPKCGFLVNSSYWSVEGCKISENDEEFIICECDHLTNFAVLMDIEPNKLSEKSNKILQYISIVGSSFSIIFLLLTFVIYLSLFKSKKTERIVILTNLVTAMALGQLLFITGSEQKENAAICLTITVFLHYLFLASFFFFLCYGVYVFTKSRNVAPSSRATLYYCLAGWGIPAIIVSATLALKFDQYVSSDMCWLSNVVSNGVIYAFVAPVLAIIATNVVILFLVIKSFFSIKANAKKEELDKLKSGIRAVLVLLPLMGLTWLFGVLQFGSTKQAEVNAYLFVIVNSLQGVSVFVCLCAFNSEVLDLLKRKLKKYKTTNLGYFSTGDSASRSPQSPRKSSAKSSGQKTLVTEIYIRPPPQ